MIIWSIGPERNVTCGTRSIILASGKVDDGERSSDGDQRDFVV